MSPEALPVWTYWEGPLPDWIVECRETIRRHVPRARFLDPDSFRELQGDDLDVDLSGLYVAHRADVIRAFLLARYGGLWLDLDCIVMRSLDEVLGLLVANDFVGHFERQGRISNAFIASRPNGRIATAYYERILEILRSGAPIQWLTLGAAALMDVLQQTSAPWHRLPCERVQPVCWSEPATFFTTDAPAGHDTRIDRSALCYMLSNNSVQGYVAGHPGADIGAPGTFFRHLVDRSLGRTAWDVSTKAVGDTFAGHVPFGLEAVAELRPGRVLDASATPGRWAALIRDLVRRNVPTVGAPWSPRIDGLAASSRDLEPWVLKAHEGMRYGDPEDIIRARTADWDLITLELPSATWSEAQVTSLIECALDAAPYVLVAARVTAPDATSAGADARRLPYLELARHDPVRAMVWREPDGADAAAVLLSRTDPRRLRRRSPAAETFQRIHRDRGWLSSESASGPGSSLTQTGTLRRELPGLLRRFRVRTLLDVPCGDLNWMRHVIGSVRSYIGADVVPALVAENRIRYGNERVTFLRLDVLADPLPRADMVLMRDLLVHLSYDDAFRAVRNVCRSGSRYLLATTFAAHDANHDIATGDWRPLNLERPPFAFPRPTRLLEEGCTEGVDGQYSDKSLGLWRVAELLPGDTDP